MKIVVDTNIVFSAMLNTDSNICRILLNHHPKLQFYSCYFLKEEIDLHKKKILKITGYSNNQFTEVQYLVTKNIIFIDHRLAGKKNLDKARVFMESIDAKDAPFYLLSKFLKAKLWTGDKTLAKGLKSAGFNETISTQDLLKLFK